MLDPAIIKDFEGRFGPVPKAVSRLIRPAFIAAPGKTLVWGDWSAIEARMLPWLAGAPGEVVLDVFRQNDADPRLPDIYEIEAAGIYDVDAVEIHGARKDGDKDAKNMRQVGKVAILALGFGGGVGALEAMATGYGIHMELDFQRKVVGRWRANNPWAVNFWSELNDAFFRAWDNPGEVYTAGRVAYIFLPDYLKGTMLCYLPDGRPLAYAALRREKVKFEDDETGEEVTEWKVRYQKGYKRGSIWHGILAENITQGGAASLLRDLLVRLELAESDVPEELYPRWVVGHTHDECITECWERDAALAEAALKAEMEFVPAWAEGLPLVAETSQNWFYTKTID